MPSANPAVQQKLGLADGSRISDAIPRLVQEFKARRWLGSQNPYRADAVAAIRDHTQTGSVLQDQEIIAYIAVSAIHHCFDGWSYLGHALQAEMACDPNVARHLGYYAELRAAMGLLASEGIGVFDRTHVVVCSKGKCHPIKHAGGTHLFAWTALENWAYAKAKNVLLRVTILSGFPLSDWLAQFPYGGVQPFAHDWLKSWGLDLQRYADDRMARNTASYRPTALVSSRPRKIDQIMSSIVQLWRVFEPIGSAKFENLDGQLMRRILEYVFLNSHGESAQKAPESYLSRISQMLNSLGLSDDERERWREFLNPVAKSSPDLTLSASGKLPAEHIDHSKQLLARAALLLRLATGCARELMAQSATAPRELLRFWWSQLAVSRRLWPVRSPPSSFSDLWEDVDESL